MMPVSRIGVFFLTVVLVGLSNGCNGGGGGGGGGPTITISTRLTDDADYTISSVQLSGPSTIAEGASAIYTVSYTVRVNARGGTVRPEVALIDEDGGFRGGGDILTKEQHDFIGIGTPGNFVATTSFTLQCVNEQIIGSLAGSGEGHEDVFGVDEAEIFAQVERFAPRTGSERSGILEVSCQVIP